MLIACQAEAPSQTTGHDEAEKRDSGDGREAPTGEGDLQKKLLDLQRRAEKLGAGRESLGARRGSRSIDQRSVEELQKAVLDAAGSTVEQRKQALDRLIQKTKLENLKGEDPWLVEFMLSIVRRDAKPEIRKAAAIKLHMLYHVDAIAALASLFDHPDRKVRFLSAEGLGVLAKRDLRGDVRHERMTVEPIKTAIIHEDAHVRSGALLAVRFHPKRSDDFLKEVSSAIRKEVDRDLLKRQILVARSIDSVRAARHAAELLTEVPSAHARAICGLLVAEDDSESLRFVFEVLRTAQPSACTLLLNAVQAQSDTTKVRKVLKSISGNRELPSAVREDAERRARSLGR
jgi:hypothetical protein